MPLFSADVKKRDVEPSSRPGTLRFLVVDDDPYYAGYLGLVIRGGFGMHSVLDIASSADEALQYLRANHYDVCFLDYSMPPKTGMDVLKAAVGFTPDTVFIFVTSNDRREDIEEALREGASNYLIKARVSPFDLFQVVSDARRNKQGDDKESSRQLALVP
jgi:two-component system response regulator YesN